MARNLNIMRINILVYVFAALILAACSSNGSTETAATAAATTTMAGKMAIDLVAGQTGVTPEQITIISEEAVDFSDSSLGCPKPGMAYMQVITPGHKVILESAGKVYDVRIAGGRGLICDNATEPKAKR